METRRTYICFFIIGACTLALAAPSCQSLNAEPATRSICDEPSQHCEHLTIDLNNKCSVYGFPIAELCVCPHQTAMMNYSLTGWCNINGRQIFSPLNPHVYNCSPIYYVCPTYYHDCAPHGYCDHSVGRCACYDGWTGEVCNFPVCKDDCNRRGSCDSPYNCSCQANWAGESCAVCAKGWTGANCDIEDDTKSSTFNGKLITAIAVGVGVAAVVALSVAALVYTAYKRKHGSILDKSGRLESAGSYQALSNNAD